MGVPVILFTFLLLVPASLCYSFIATGRGLIIAQQWDPYTYTIKETTGYYYNDDDALLWSFEKDSRFPNGVFIRSKALNMVWDIQGQQYAPGTPIILYNKKSTLQDTKNQRWELVNHRYGSINDQNWVASVNSAGDVVLAQKATSDYQNFYPLEQYSEVPVSLQFPYESIFVSIASPLGTKEYIQVTGSSLSTKLFPGTVITFKDSYGKVVTPSPLNINTNVSLQIPPPTFGSRPFTSFYRGGCCCMEGGWTNTIGGYLSFSEDLVFSATDAFDCYSSYDVVNGTYTPTGLVIFKKDYGNGVIADCVARASGSGFGGTCTMVDGSITTYFGLSTF